MVEINNNIIRFSRGDEVTFTFSATDESGSAYQFQAGDVINFRIMPANGYNKELVLEKDFTINEATTSVEISLTPQETTIGEEINKPKDYWYEIALNEYNTIVGYDKGPAILTLLPARV